MRDAKGLPIIRVMIVYLIGWCMTLSGIFSHFVIHVLSIVDIDGLHLRILQSAIANLGNNTGHAGEAGVGPSATGTIKTL